MQLLDVRCPRCGTSVVAADIFCGYCHFQLPAALTETTDGAVVDDDRETIPQPDGPIDGRGRRRRRGVIAAIVAIAVVATLVLSVVGRDAREPSTGSSALPSLDRATQRWQQVFAAPVLAITSDDDTIFVMTADAGLFSLRAFEASSGEQRWETPFDLRGDYDFSRGFASRGTAQLAVVGGQLVAVYGPGAHVAGIDPATGDVRWSEQTSEVLAIDSGALMIGSSGAQPAAQVILPHGLGPRIDDVALVAADGRIFVDHDGVLTIAGDGSDRPFRFEHRTPVEMLVPLADGSFVAEVVTSGQLIASSILVGLDSHGTEEWTYDAGNADVAAVQPMSGGRLLVGIGSGFRVLALDGRPHQVSDIRSYQRVVVGAGPQGRDVLYATQGRNSGGSTTMSVVDVVDDRFVTIADVAGFVNANTLPNGRIAYLTTGGTDDIRGREIDMLAAVETSTGQTLWRMDVPPSLLVWTDSSFALVDEGERPTLSLYSD